MSCVVGERREPIFRDEEDRERFLETLDQARERTGWPIHAQVLMANHYHWLLETPEVSEHLRMGHAGNISKVVRAVEGNEQRGTRWLKRRLARVGIPTSED